MDDLFKKFINTGVGFLSQSNKRVQAALDKLVQESKISEQEGKKIMDDLLRSGEARRNDLEKQLQDLAGSLRDRVGRGSEEKAPTPPAKPKAAKRPSTNASAKNAGTTPAAEPKASSKKPASGESAA